MKKNGEHAVAPIFVVGSPRSGTSILTWCLGQHPNILPTEESDWLGPFAVQVAALHVRGCARGERSQLSALGIERAEFLENFGRSIDATILGHRATLERLNHAVAERDPMQVCADFSVARSAAEPKARWVDGTPEYSLYISGLHQLFPAAKFIHILREPDEVAASMLAFHREHGAPLVTSADEAYAYWERTTAACALAAQALGATFVHRLRHADLAAQPAAVLHDVFEFLGEEFAAECVAPLAHRINSSFSADTRPAAGESPTAASERVQHARQLCERIGAKPVPSAPSPQAQAQMEADFEVRVSRAANLDDDFAATQRLFEALQQTAAATQAGELEQAQVLVEDKTRQLAATRRALAICGIVVALQAACAIAVYVLTPAVDARAAWLAFAGASALVYAWLRRAGLRRLFARPLPTIVAAPESRERT